MKRGQNANPQSYIALLIFVIGVILVVYILALPPGERQRILEQNATGGDGDDAKDTISVLLEREPGTISNLAKEEIIHNLGEINLYTSTEATELIDPLDSIHVSRSLFDMETRNITFGAGNLQNTDNIKLSFNAREHEGRLTVTLNGQTILSRDIETYSPPAISLPKDLLRDTNTLHFSVSGPGILFWETNNYALENIQITADVTDRSSQQASLFFHVSELELENTESFELSFGVGCRASAVEPLVIQLNKQTIYNSVPECESRVDIPARTSSRLREGENDLLFRTEEGNYLIYNIRAQINLEEAVFPTYYFHLPQETYNKIDDDDADINVTVLFTNDEEAKQGFIYVNGVRYEFDPFDMKFNRRIDEIVREGNNAIEIRPQSERLDILELKVLLAE